MEGYEVGDAIEVITTNTYWKPKRSWGSGVVVEAEPKALRVVFGDSTLPMTFVWTRSNGGCWIAWNSRHSGPRVRLVKPGEVTW